MQITLDNSEVIIAITEYVENQGIRITGKTLEVNMFSKRGNMVVATIDISDPKDTVSAEVSQKEEGVGGSDNATTETLFD